MQQPEIFEDLIRRRGAEEERSGTIKHGVGASTSDGNGHRLTPHHPVSEKVSGVRPQEHGSQGEGISKWAKLVHEPAYKAVHRYTAALQSARYVGPGVPGFPRIWMRWPTSWKLLRRTRIAWKVHTPPRPGPKAQHEKLIESSRTGGTGGCSQCPASGAHRIRTPWRSPLPDR